MHCFSRSFLPCLAVVLIAGCEEEVSPVSVAKQRAKEMREPLTRVANSVPGWRFEPFVPAEVQADSVREPHVVSILSGQFVNDSTGESLDFSLVSGHRRHVARYVPWPFGCYRPSALTSDSSPYEIEECPAAHWKGFAAVMPKPKSDSTRNEFWFWSGNYGNEWSAIFDPESMFSSTGVAFKAHVTVPAKFPSKPQTPADAETFAWPTPELSATQQALVRHLFPQMTPAIDSALGNH
jgi:hypothetical protein